VTPAAVPALPGPLADPLHILPPALLPLLFVLGSLLIGALFIAGVTFIGSQFRKGAVRPGLRPHISTALEQIEYLQREFGKSAEYREGCHRLSLVMKTHFEGVTGRAVEEMTAGEIRRTFAGSEPAKFFGVLTGLQFHRGEPQPQEFEDICTYSKNVLRSIRKGKASHA